MKKLNHSRYIGSQRAQYQARLEYESVKSTPTYKQRRYHYRLLKECEFYDIEVPEELKHPEEIRSSYMDAISSLRNSLIAIGVDPHGNNKEAVTVYYPADSYNADSIGYERIYLKEE